MRVGGRLRFAFISVLTVVMGFQIGLARAQADDSAEEILKTAMKHYDARMQGIQNYTLVQSVGGMRIVLYFERVQSEDGRPHFRHVTSMPHMERVEKAETNELLEQSGGEMADPYAMINRIAPRSRLQGKETVNGREAYVISVDDMSDIDFEAMDGMSSEADSEAFQPKSMKIWLDTKDYVPLRTIVKGTMEMEEGKATDVTFDISMSDYRDVDGMLHPFHTEMTMEGMEAGLTSEQQAELKKAREEMEEQLKGMDDSQRAMVEKMMKDRMPNMESMMGSGPMKMSIEVDELRVNEGPPESRP